MAVSNTLRYQEANCIIRNATTKQLPLSHARIRYIIRKVFRAQRISSQWPLSIAFVSDSTIKKVNRRYLAHKGPTDVLSFGYNNNSAELLISLDTARRNAKIYRASLKDEITLYIIHGLLHLMGYDDRNPTQRRMMLKRQEEILHIIIRRSPSHNATKSHA